MANLLLVVALGLYAPNWHNMFIQRSRIPLQTVV